MTAEVRQLCPLDDNQVAALFNSLFSKSVPIERFAFSEYTLRELRNQYEDPVESKIVLDEQLQGMPALSIGNAMASDGKSRGTLLAIDCGACRIFTFVP